MKKTRATAVVIKDGKILMIHRFCEGKEYYVLPGGKVEEGETVEEAVIRELLEETTITAQLGKLISIFDDGGSNHQLFLCHYVSGEPKLSEDSSEKIEMNENNQYYPMWVKVEKLKDFTIWPEGTKEFLLKYLS